MIINRFHNVRQNLKRVSDKLKFNLMAKNKTTENKNSVPEYLNTISDENRRNNCSEIIELIYNLTGLEPKMWGTGIVGFGT